MNRHSDTSVRALQNIRSSTSLSPRPPGCPGLSVRTPSTPILSGATRTSRLTSPMSSPRSPRPCPARHPRRGQSGDRPWRGAPRVGPAQPVDGRFRGRRYRTGRGQPRGSQHGAHQLSVVGRCPGRGLLPTHYTPFSAGWPVRSARRPSPVHMSEHFPAHSSARRCTRPLRSRPATPKAAGSRVSSPKTSESARSQTPAVAEARPDSSTRPGARPQRYRNVTTHGST